MASRRQSCDRCHGQKLRCTRAGGLNTGVCNRCLKQGTQCVYSFSLPKGRPNIYRVADSTRKHTSAPATLIKSITPPSSPENPSQCPSGGGIITNDINSNPGGRSNAYTESASSNDGDAASLGIPNRESLTKATEDIILPEPDVKPESISWPPPTSVQPWIEPFNWDDMQMDMNEPGMNQLTWSVYAMGDPPSGSSAALQDSFSYFPTWPPSGQTDSNIQRASPTSSCWQNLTHGLDPGMAQLSQLSTRLYPLHQASCALVDAIGASVQLKDGTSNRPSPVIDDTVFKSITTWVIHVSANMSAFPIPEYRNSAISATSLGDVLLNAFSTSRELLGILWYLQKNANGNLGYSPTTTPSIIENASYGDQVNSLPTNPLCAPSQYSDTVIHHLVIVCHTLILSIYAALLTVLQHDVDFRNHCHSNRADDKLADIQPAMTVQLCSYLIGRQYEVVGSYLLPNNASQMYDTPIPGDPNSSLSPAPGREALQELEIEVQQRITKLRGSLRI